MKTGSCVPVLELRLGEPARLCEEHPKGHVPERLLELGFVPGTPFLLRSRAPLGDPWEVEIRGARLCFRRDELSGLCAIREQAAA